MKTATDLVNTAVGRLLTVNGLSIDYIGEMLNKLKSSGIDFGDIFFMRSVSESWRLSESKIKSGAFSIDQGFGVRGVSGEKTTIAHSDEINEKSLRQAVKAARSFSQKVNSSDVNLCLSPSYKVYRDGSFDPINSLSREKKVFIVNEMDKFARSLDSRVREVKVSLSSSNQQSLLFTTDGVAAAENNPQVNLNCSVIVEDNGVSETGWSASGRSADLNFFLEDVPVLPFDYVRGVSDNSLSSMEARYMAVARDAVRQALNKLKALQVRAGTMPVVLASGWPAVLIHESIGHGLEGDSCRKGQSVFAGRIGEQVASDLCTIVDDGTLENGTGTFNVDSEGVPSQRNVLIENGILKGFMYDRLNAAMDGVKSTGNGRRADYYCKPIPRMTNTYLLPGKDKPQDIIKSLDDGIYAVDFNGGQIDTAAGKFTFTATEAYRVKNGEIKYPVKDATLIGNAMTAMRNISMVGDNLEFDKGTGSCGKAGQMVRVGLGQPTLRMDSVTVGGTK